MTPLLCENDYVSFAVHTEIVIDGTLHELSREEELAYSIIVI